ncbi:MAG TPA: flagellar biosynthetic protein FliP, partial [Desulfobulbus sp.]|nr:flagellar biosynthetic protein FliP [Desulfobulbus sp.]
MKRILLPTLLALLFLATSAGAVNLPTVSLGIKNAAGPQQVSTALQVLFVLTILSVAPAILLMTTAFTRIVIVLGFVRQAMGTQNMPPNQIIIGLALFLTFFIMSPVINRINTTAYQPYMAKKISEQQALDRTVEAMRGFMFSQVQEDELQLLIEITGKKQPRDRNDISTMILIPAFMLS